MTEFTDRPIMESNQALQAALELSMLNLNNTTYSTTPDPPFGLFDDQPLLGSKKSQNITQCVAVPSSEHVAEIVGRQGCKIKALRAKTNTYIKTPVRGDDPIFIITGRPEDVSAAKREILAAADHFTQIRAARRSNSTSSPSNFGGPSSSPVEENKTTIYVRVPYRVVGLVVGPKGATVKRIQQITNTYIVTPSRDKEPCFEVTGSPESVERARKEIESYIAMRTGGSIDSDYDSDYQALLSPAVDSVFSPSTHLSRRASEVSTKVFQFPVFTRNSASPPDFSPPTGLEGDNWADKTLHSSPLSSAVFGASEGSLDSYQTFAMPMSAPVTSSDRIFDFSNMQNALIAFKPQPPSPTGSCESNSSEGTAATSPKQSPKLPQRHLSSSCYICHEREVVAALVPCGHNLFCYSCACQIQYCPLCNIQVSTVLRIYTS